MAKKFSEECRINFQIISQGYSKRYVKGSNTETTEWILKETAVDIREERFEADFKISKKKNSKIFLKKILKNFARGIAKEIS